jgi:hypothetical protein
MCKMALVVVRPHSLGSDHCSSPAALLPSPQGAGVRGSA